jgi:uncharacterized membrane protein
LNRFEKTISYLLLVGVAISLILETIGMILFHHSYGYSSVSEEREMFIHGRNFFKFVVNLFEGRYVGKEAMLLMSFGMVALILTPYVRVAMSVFYFAWEKNIKYVVITSFVLALLTISLTVK